MSLKKAVALDQLKYFLGKLGQTFAAKGHASSGTEHGAASASLYGHAKASSTLPKAPGAASAGSETSSFARGDHVHPKQAMDKATASAIGAVKPDGKTTKVDANGAMSAVQPTEAAMFLAAHPVGCYYEASDGANPMARYGGTWEAAPSLGPFRWHRTK